MNRTPALPLFAAPLSLDVPLIVSAPLPELVTEAVAKRVPSVAPVPLVDVDRPVTLTLPPVTVNAEELPKITPVPVFEVPEKDASPETLTLVETPPSSSRPR